MTVSELRDILLTVNQDKQVTLPGEAGPPIQYVKVVHNSAGTIWVELS